MQGSESLSLFFSVWTRFLQYVTHQTSPETTPTKVAVSIRLYVCLCQCATHMLIRASPDPEHHQSYIIFITWDTRTVISFQSTRNVLSVIILQQYFSPLCHHAAVLNILLSFSACFIKQTCCTATCTFILPCILPKPSLTSTSFKLHTLKALAPSVGSAGVPGTTVSDCWWSVVSPGRVSHFKGTEERDLWEP